MYGVWPGEWVFGQLAAIMGTGGGGGGGGGGEIQKIVMILKDMGKIIGGFLSSALVHSFASYCVSGGSIPDAMGEFYFFTENGGAVLLEEAVQMLVVRYRRREKRKSKRRQEGTAPPAVQTVIDLDSKRDDDSDDDDLRRWYDPYIGRIWFIAVILFSGRNFARGWVSSGLVREMAELGGKGIWGGGGDP